MTIALTGATGQLGRLVIDELLKTVPAAEIVAIARDTAKAADLEDLGVQVRIAAYGEAAPLQSALAGVDRLLLISASVPGQRVAQHGSVIEAAKAAGVGFIAYTSILGGATANPLSSEHVATEALLADSGIPHTLLRHGWYNENYLSTAPGEIAQGTVLTSAGNGRVASASRADFAAGDAVVLTGSGHDGAVYEFSGDTAWSTEEYAAVLSELSGKTVTVTPVTTEAHATALAVAGLDEGTIGFITGLDAAIADGALAQQTGDLSRLIGRQTTPLIETLREASIGS